MEPRQPKDGPGRKAAHRMMRELNRSIILDILREGRQMSRVDLARRTHLSKPTVSSIVSALIAEQRVIEIGPLADRGTGGRPPSQLTYNHEAEAFVGVDFGVVIRVALADGLGRVITTLEAPQVFGDPPRTVSTVAALVDEALEGAQIDRDRLQGAGVAVPGLVERDSGRCLLSTTLRWEDVPIQDMFEAALDLPVSVRHTTMAATIAEGESGAAAGVNSYVWVYAGQGIGAGIVIDGSWFSGTSGFAGEIGHCRVVDDGPQCTCGKRGCLMAVAGARAIARAAAEAVEARRKTSLAAHQDLDSEAVIDAALEGDAVAREIIEAAGARLGQGISYLLNILNTELVVVGGTLSRAGDIYLDAARKVVTTDAMSPHRVEVVATALGDQAPLLGVLRVAVGRAAESFRIIRA